jgi:hypothetical protein
MKPLVLMLLLLTQNREATQSVERTFVSGGVVTLKLSSGDYKIQAGSSDKIVVRSFSKKRFDIDDAVRITIRGDEATVRTDGPIRDTHFVIELPARSDIKLNLRAGDLEINGIEGNKDVRMTAGELDIDMGPGTYSRVEASVTFGDLQARSLGKSKSGIARGFDWNGSGIYKLKAHLFAGDINLR